MWVSQNIDGTRIKAEMKNPRHPNYRMVMVNKRGGEVVDYSGCTPGDAIFAKLVKEARTHCAA